MIYRRPTRSSARSAHHDSEQSTRNLTHKSLVTQIAYPAVVTAGLLLHLSLLQAGFSLQISTYSPVILAAVIITFLEQKFPYRRAWLPSRSDLALDLKYMTLVQTLLPKLLSFIFALTLAGQLDTHHLTLQRTWPFQASPVIQALLMLLTADFFRYWLHRASHEWFPGLWRLHAVHHAPPKLYWGNVGRFHALEKILQFFFDALPFIMLGVSDLVLALYFVFYAINGFFQHSNIDLKLGFLNILVAGPELHRWHHSAVAQEGNCNYGNNLILWDLLFGTYFCPQGRQVKAIGLHPSHH